MFSPCTQWVFGPLSPVTAENNNIQNVPYKMVTFGANSGYIVNVLTEFAQVTFLGKF